MSVFKINDLVKIMKYSSPYRRNWIIVGFASNNSEAILRNIYTRTQSINFLTDLKHQKPEKSNG